MSQERLIAQKRPLRHRIRSFFRKERFLNKILSEKTKQHIYGISNCAIIAGDAGMHIAKGVAEELNKTNPPSNPNPFKSHELRIVVPPEEIELPTKDVYVIQSTNGYPDSAINQLKLLEEAAKGEHANRIFAVVTHLPYSRQDRRDQRGAPEAARLFAREILRAGSHDPQKIFHESALRENASLILVDIHSERPLHPLTRANDMQWVNLDPRYVMEPVVQRVVEENHLDVAILYPDKSAKDRNAYYADKYVSGAANAGVINKVRPVEKSNTVEISENQEDLTAIVKGKDVLMFDDMVDTAGSILQAAKRAKEQGAKSVRVIATHGVFSEGALENISNEAIDGVIVTDSIAQQPEILKNPKIQVVSIVPLITEAIKRIEAREPMGELAKSMSPDFEYTYRRLKTRANYYRRKNARNVSR